MSSRCCRTSRWWVMSVGWRRATTGSPPTTSPSSNSHLSGWAGLRVMSPRPSLIQRARGAGLPIGHHLGPVSFDFGADRGEFGVDLGDLLLDRFVFLG